MSTTPKPNEVLTQAEKIAEALAGIPDMVKKLPLSGRRAALAIAVAEWMVKKDEVSEGKFGDPTAFTTRLVQWSYPPHSQISPSPAMTAGELDQTLALYVSCKQGVLDSFKTDKTMQANVKEAELRESLARRTAAWMLGRKDVRRIASPAKYAAHTLSGVYVHYPKALAEEIPFEQLLTNVAEGFTPGSHLGEIATPGIAKGSGAGRGE